MCKVIIEPVGVYISFYANAVGSNVDAHIPHPLSADIGNNRVSLGCGKRTTI